MITYFILNKSGDIIYHSSNTKRQLTTEESRICYLPLLLTKDLIRSHLNGRLQYLKTGNKTIAFWEKHSLLYVAWTNNTQIPVSLLQQHLRSIYCFLRFTYGPQWHSHVQTSMGSSRSQRIPLISLSGISDCLSRLDFLTGPPSLRSSGMLCFVEQVELHEDLRSRLVSCLRECCENAFPFSSRATSSSTKLASFFTPPKRTMTVRSHPHDKTVLMESFRGTEPALHQWTDAFLFAREKIVVRCSNPLQSMTCNGDDTDDVSDNLLYYLKSLLVQYLDVRAEKYRQYNTRQSGSSPQDISRQSSANSLHETTSVNSTSLPTLCTSSSTSDTPSQKSPFTFVYSSSSSAPPYKIREKTPSSVMVVPSNVSSPSISWSSPPPLIYNRLLSQFSQRSSHTLSRFSSIDPLSIPSRVDSHHSSDTQLPPNAAALYIHPSSSNPVLSSTNNYMSNSLPSEPAAFLREQFPLRSSTHSSPTTRSRKNSFTEQIPSKDSIKHLITNLLHSDPEDDTPDDDLWETHGKVFRGWIKKEGQLFPCRIFLTSVSNEFCAMVVCRDDLDRSEKIRIATQPVRTRPSVFRQAHQLQCLQQNLQDMLQDFSAFLLTKEAAHFTILSFAVAYPGLLHFMHMEKGIMVAPQLVDLNELDKDFEVLHGIFSRYDFHSKTTLYSAQWPRATKLKRLSDQMACLGDNMTSGSRIVRVLEDKGPGSPCEFTYLYQRGQHGEELRALYFGFVPPERMWEMHQRLFQDISQRIL
ncbi:uncharacterized protein BYT42DRAFT_565226 [Radiomyces spectabilis]|uniref:uncharacterized protein n=1 Tax=Radiomyces spectabilis TaxID=64574 RepID=UPI002220E669|nr:uncharacterized protein BYT42DRAFT_565226 [Radiomyces spectabilis]KAI8381096.1 hypothetical protein BYT42DRAFT_565226 [Radiomyces spectabilis]